MTAAAISVFYPRDIKRFLENLDFHGLATEQALQFPHSTLEFTHLASADDIFIRLHRPQATLEHSPAPVEQQTRGNPRSSSNIGNRHPGLHRLLDQPNLLGGWPTATALN